MVYNACICIRTKLLKIDFNFPIVNLFIFLATLQQQQHMKYYICKLIRYFKGFVGIQLCCPSLDFCVVFIHHCLYWSCYYLAFDHYLVCTPIYRFSFFSFFYPFGTQLTATSTLTSVYDSPVPKSVFMINRGKHTSLNVNLMV